jgi:RES domain
LEPDHSLFSERRHLREEVSFLWDFRRDAVSPVDPSIADYEYTPTQVVAEYFRRGCEYQEGKHLDGILYPSSKVHNGHNYVFFADRRNIDGVADDILSVSGIKKFRMTAVDHRHLPKL